MLNRPRSTTSPTCVAVLAPPPDVFVELARRRQATYCPAPDLTPATRGSRSKNLRQRVDKWLRFGDTATHDDDRRAQGRQHGRTRRHLGLDQRISLDAARWRSRERLLG